METTLERSPGAVLRSLPTGSFVRVDDLPGTRSAARNAASRAARRGELVQLRRGLYFKGTPTRYGTATPDAELVALAVLGDRGVGPTGVSAARALGLTTQLPAVPHLVTCGPVPTGLSAVAVSRRNNLARLQLGYTEVAVLELLRDWQTTTQATWGQIVTAVTAAIDAGALDTNKLAAAGRCEPHPNVRHDLTALLNDAAQPGQAIA